MRPAGRFGRGRGAAAMRFREEPRGDVDLAKDGVQLLRRGPKVGKPVRSVPKAAFSEEPCRKFAGKGQWFELRVEESLGGESCLMAIGFTGTDPATLAQNGGQLPARAHGIPKTFLAGYAHSAFWDGERSEAVVFKDVRPFKIFTIGALATPAGSLEVYVDRKMVLNFDPTVRGLPPIDTEQPLWVVVDACGGLKKATLLTESLPPETDEEEAAGAARAADEEA